MKIIKIYTIWAARKLLLSVEVISRYSQVWLGGWWLGPARNKTFIDEKCAPGGGDLSHQTLHCRLQTALHWIVQLYSWSMFEGTFQLFEGEECGRWCGRVLVSTYLLSISTLAQYNYTVFCILMNSIMLEEKRPELKLDINTQPRNYLGVRGARRDRWLQ